MATIPLRAYNREIENLIDTGRVDEAIAHCRHILQAFPKHVATYRLFGKAHLESQRFGDASDIFARVLSAIPDDFVANVGMSIVREDEGNLDAAIWHMERAFETQPANSAIQEELRRLYGRRDGVEPLKVRLTRGALARMYAKSDLYDQAIAELRAALSEDSQRPDLQVLLAQMYYAAGQKVDAVATSTALIQKFPYCLEANRVLTAILPETERAADTQIYQQRIIAMDPYTARSDTASLTTENVPDDAVTIEKLVLKPGQSTIGAEQPAWAASLENAFEDTSSKLPEWLTESPETPALVSGAKAFPSRVSPISTEEQPEGEEITTTGAPAEAPEPSAEIPEWMQEAGWKPATGEAQEGPISFDEGTDFELPEGEIAPGQIPDWLKDMAPSGTLEEEIPSTSEELEKASLPWLEEKEPGTTDTVISWLDREQPKEEPHVESPTSEELATEEGSLPDWLAEMKPPAVAAPPESAEITEAIPEEGLPEAPPWLAGEETVTPESKTTPAKEQQPPSGDTEALPDWLRSPAEPETERTGITDWLREVQEESPAPSDEMPVWLKEMEQEIPGEQETPPPTDWFAEQTEAKPRIVPEELDAAPTSAEELPDWLSEMAEPAQREEEAPAELAAGLPEWPAEEPAAVEAATDELEAAPTPAEELPDWLSEMAEPAQREEEAPAEPFAGLPEWPAEEPAAVEAAPEELEAAPTPAEELPDWLSEMAEPAPPVELPADEAPTLVAAPPPSAPDLDDEDAALAWLESLAAKHGAAEEELITKPEERLEAPPEWIVEEAGAEELEATPTPAEELPDWLSEMAEPAPEEEAPAELAVSLPEWPAEEPAATVEAATEELEAAPTPAEELPDWLSEMAEPAPPVELPADEAPTPVAAPPPTAPDLGDEDAALAWLESLAAKHGAAEEELITKPEERLEAPPEWVVEEAEAPPLPAGAEDLPEWLAEVPAAVETAPEELEAAPTPAEELPDWLSEMAEPPPEKEEAPAEPVAGLSERLAEEPATVEAATEELEAAPTPAEELPDWSAETSIEPEARPEEGIPDWMKDTAISKAAPEIPIIEEISEITAPAEPEPAEIQPSPTISSEQPSAELLDINTASLSQLEALPGIGFVLAQSIIAYRDTYGLFATVDDLEKISGIGPGIVSEIRHLIASKAPDEKRLPRTAPLPADEAEAEFVLARSAITEGDGGLAAKHYSRLVKKGTQLDQVIADLQEALYRFPVDINIWQTLGDAYLRSNKLKDALEAYIKAEELLR